MRSWAPKRAPKRQKTNSTGLSLAWYSNAGLHGISWVIIELRSADHRIDFVVTCSTYELHPLAGGQEVAQAIAHAAFVLQHCRGSTDLLRCEVNFTK